MKDNDPACSDCGPDVLHTGQGTALKGTNDDVGKNVRTIPRIKETDHMKKSTRYFRMGFKSIAIIYVVVVLLGLIFNIPLNFRLAIAMMLMIVPCVQWCIGGIHRLLENDREVQALPEVERNRVIADRTIDYVMLIDTDEKKELKANPFTAAVRGWVGRALGGNVGKWAGIMTTKMRIETKATKATFLVAYKSGRSEFETVKVGSLRYKQLMKRT